MTLAEILVRASQPAARCAGTAGDDEIFRTFGGDRLDGHLGVDWLHGGSGRGILLSSPGNDQLHAAAGAAADPSGSAAVVCCLHLISSDYAAPRTGAVAKR